MAYFITATVRARRGGGEEKQQVLFFIACYCLYIQILRIPLAFVFFQHSLRWRIPLISKIAILALVLHACTTLTHSFLQTTPRRIHVRMWIACGLVVSLWIAYAVPLDIHLLTEQVIHKVGYFVQLQIFLAVIYLVILINGIKHYVETRRKSDMWLPIGCVLQGLVLHITFTPHITRTTVGGAVVALLIATTSIIIYTQLRVRPRE